MTKIDPKMLKIEPKICKKCVSYCKIPTQDKNRGTSPLNPIAGPRTYWAAPAQLPTQFAPLVLPGQTGGAGIWLLTLSDIAQYS